MRSRSESKSGRSRAGLIHPSAAQLGISALLLLGGLLVAPASSRGQSVAPSPAVPPTAQPSTPAEIQPVRPAPLAPPIPSVPPPQAGSTPPSVSVPPAAPSVRRSDAVPDAAPTQPAPGGAAAQQGSAGVIQPPATGDAIAKPPPATESRTPVISPPASVDGKPVVPK